VKVLPSDIRATSSRGCSPVAVAQSDTAWRLFKGRCPTSARATGEVSVPPLELRTLPVILIEALGTATVGVMLVSETISDGVKTWLGVSEARALCAVAAGACARLASSDIISSEIASKVDEVACRLTRPGSMFPLTSRLLGAPMRHGLFAVRWGR